VWSAGAGAFWGAWLEFTGTRLACGTASTPSPAEVVEAGWAAWHGAVSAQKPSPAGDRVADVESTRMEIYARRETPPPLYAFGFPISQPFSAPHIQLGEFPGLRYPSSSLQSRRGLVLESSQWRRRSRTSR